MSTFRKSSIVHKSTKDGSSGVLYVTGPILIPEKETYATREDLLLDDAVYWYSNNIFIPQKYESVDSASLLVESIDTGNDFHINITNLLYTIHNKFGSITNLAKRDCDGEYHCEKILTSFFLKENKFTIIGPYSDGMFMNILHGLTLGNLKKLYSPEKIIIEVNKSKEDIISDINDEYTLLLFKSLVSISIIAFGLC
jgi:hypothetical protein